MSVQEFYEQIFVQYPKISIDSRNVSKDILFFSLKGSNFNGNQYALSALQNGASYAIVDDESIVHSRVICVPDVLLFLQKLAAYHREQLSIPIIGITGTNGKTTTKELIAAVLSEKYKVTFTKGNLNNHIGVPLTILSVSKSDDIAVIEMGANHMGEIAFLCDIVKPDFGIITNVGKAHLEGFGSFENVITTKSELYRSIESRNGTIFIDADNDILMKVAETIESKILYSCESNLTYAYAVSKQGVICAAFDFYTDSSHVSIQSQLFGEYNIKNMLAAATIGKYFDVSLDKIAFALESYTPSNNRSQILTTNKNTLILDAYNANPSSMQAAISYFHSVNFECKGAILGEMLELGDSHVDEHSYVQKMILKGYVSFVYFVGKWEYVNDSRCKFFSSTQDLFSFLQSVPIEHSLVLIKGSRGVALEKIVDLL